MLQSITIIPDLNESNLHRFPLINTACLTQQLITKTCVLYMIFAPFCHSLREREREKREMERTI